MDSPTFQAAKQSAKLVFAKPVGRVKVTLVKCSAEDQLASADDWHQC